MDLAGRLYPDSPVACINAAGVALLRALPKPFMVIATQNPIEEEGTFNLPEDEHTPLPDASAYTAAKHALGGLTKAMALELVRHKILVNAVAPGAIATPMNGMDDSDVKPDAEPSIPLRRFGATHEIASLVAWLCSEGANYTTGQSLIVDGGFMLANPQFNPE